MKYFTNKVAIFTDKLPKISVDNIFRGKSARCQVFVPANRALAMSVDRFLRDGRVCALPFDGLIYELKFYFKSRKYAQ